MSAPEGNKNALGNKGGRPEKYTQEFLKDLADKLIKWFKSSEDNIFINNFCIDNDVDKRNLSNLCEKSQEFSRAYNKFITFQEGMILKQSYKRERSEQISKFLLINNHGYVSDKTQAQVDQTSKVQYNVIIHKD